MDPVRGEARRFAAIVIVVAVAVLGLFEAIAHRGQGVDAPGAPAPAVSAAATTIQAPGQP